MTGPSLARRLRAATTLPHPPASGAGRDARCPRGLGLWLCLLVATPAGAQNWQLRTDGNLEVGFEDNVRLTAEDPQAAWRVNAAVVARALRATEVSQVGFLLGIRGNRFIGIDDLDNNGFRLAAQSSVQGERHQLRVDAGLDSESTLTSEAATSGVTQINAQRYLFTVNPGLTYALSERGSLDLRLGYSKVFYEDAGDTALSDYWLATASLEGRYRLSERADVSVGLDYATYEANQPSSSYENVGVSLGASYQLSETWLVSGTFGLRHTDAQQGGALGQATSGQSTGQTYSLTLNRRFDDGGGLALQLTRELVPSGTAELLDSISASVGLTRRLSERLGLALGARANRNRQPDGVERASDLTALNGTLGLTYTLGQAWTLSAAYQHRREQRDDDSGSASSNAIFVTLAWNHGWDL